MIETDNLHEEFDSFCEHFRIAQKQRYAARRAFYFGALKMAFVLRRGVPSARQAMQNIEEFLSEPDRCRCEDCKQAMKSGTAFSPVAFFEEWIDEQRN